MDCYQPYSINISMVCYTSHNNHKQVYARRLALQGPHTTRQTKLHTHQRGADIDFLTPDPYPINILNIHIQSLSENF